MTYNYPTCDNFYAATWNSDGLLASVSALPGFAHLDACDACIDVFFDSGLSAEDKTTLDGYVAPFKDNPTVDPDTFE